MSPTQATQTSSSFRVFLPNNQTSNRYKSLRTLRFEVHSHAWVKPNQRKVFSVRPTFKNPLLRH